MAPHDPSSLAEYYVELSGSSVSRDTVVTKQGGRGEPARAKSGTMAEALAGDHTICDEVVIEGDGDCHEGSLKDDVISGREMPIDDISPVLDAPARHTARNVSAQSDKQAIQLAQFADETTQPVEEPAIQLAQFADETTQPAEEPGPYAIELTEAIDGNAEAPATASDCPGALLWLKGAREANGIALDRISAETKIPPHLLEQLEQGDLSGWPRGIYAKAYARAYAVRAGLDADEVVAVVAGCLPQESLEDIRRARDDFDAARARRGSAIPMFERLAVTPPQLAVLALGAVLLLALLTPLFSAFTSGTSEQPSVTPATETYARPSHLRAEPPPRPRPLRPVRTTGTKDAVAVPSDGAAPPPKNAALPGSEGSVPSADATTLRGTPRLATLDVGEAPVFSPAFAAGNMVVYHAGARTRGVLKAAHVGEDGNVVDVRTLRDDGARNYHVRFSPDGRAVAFDSDREGERGVYIANPDGSEPRRISGVGFGAIPNWSPDGRRVSFVRGETGNPNVWNLWIADVATNELKRLTSNKRGQPWGGSWFPDGQRICYSLENALVVLDTTTGRARTFPSPRRGTMARTPAVSPDGSRVIFQVYRDGVWMLDVTDGSMRRLLDDRSAEEFNWSPDGKRVAFHSRRDGGWKLWLMEL